MSEVYQINRKKTFHSIFLLYFMMFFCGGILPVNIGNLLAYLPKTTKFGIGIVSVSSLIIGIISILIFGYYGDKISERFSRKTIFIYTNFIWILTYGLASLSLNYFYYLLFIIVGAIGAGAFLPLGFSMIGDFYSPKDRGKKYGMMQFSLTLGAGMGIIFGGLLGNYAGPLGWRIAYGIGFIFGLFTLIFYTFSAIEPERLRSEPEFENFKGEINYNYKITYSNLKQLFRTRSVGGILISVFCSGIANVTLGMWAIFYLTIKIDSMDAELIVTTIYILAGSGALLGAIIGGRLGDRYFRSGKLKGRVVVSLIGLIVGISLLSAFYLIPFYTETIVQVVFSWIFFVIIGYLGFFFVAFSSGNQFAIYSEVSLPEIRSTANAMNGLMVNLGGIIGNLVISSMIERNISLLPYAILLVLIIWLLGSLFWIIPYFYYPRELKECREILLQRRNDLERKL
ncbi:MAG: MFS transporter [Candidatus Lokiarchaeota archaeon]|nr:MFS transporter [Candidatus Lokiarchaeota archaeon]